MNQEDTGLQTPSAKVYIAKVSAETQVMSVAGGCEEQFLCSICLDVFSEPVSTPCGHNFCKECISQTWRQSQHCFCPLCKEVFHPKPELKTNTLLRQMVSQHMHEAEDSSKPSPIPVFCTFCTEPRLKALKSCLVCLSSFCESHLQPHIDKPELKTHPLTAPLDNMEDRLCPEHQRPLELFCSVEQCCVCSMCAFLRHKNHELLSLEEAGEHRRAARQQTVVENQSLVEQRRLKVQEIQRCLDLSQKEARRETTALVQVFTDIMDTVKKCLTDNTEEIEQTQRAHKKQAELMISELQQEMCELQKSNTEAQMISHSTDPLYVLQHCPAQVYLPGLKEWSNVTFEPQSYKGSLEQALSELEQSLSKELSIFKQKYNLSNTVFKPKDFSTAFEPKQTLANTVSLQKSLMSPKAELRRLQQFAVDITLDSATAHAELVVSKDLKQVYHSDEKKWLPLSSRRFDCCANVLGKQSFSSGKSYFQVQVQGKTDFDVGVAHASMKRKGAITASPRYDQWSICLRKSNMYSACTEPWTPLSLNSAPQRIGVFVDYEGGLVSFYDADSADLIYFFTGCCFRDKLLPLLSPCNNNRGTNSAPLIISAVRASPYLAGPYSAYTM